MRRAALLLRVHRITVARKVRFLAQQAHLELSRTWAQDPQRSSFQFDEMETFEHSKCKPLSIAVAVSPIDRKILGLSVASMPCKGLLAEKARQKYGPRKDERRKTLQDLLVQVRKTVKEDSFILSDENPRYASLVARIFPKGRYSQVPGLRGCVTGYGELKRGSWDPLFVLNHTCAMIRDNIKRLARRTWCTTKKKEALADHLLLYAQFHNSVLTA